MENQTERFPQGLLKLLGVLASCLLVISIAAILLLGREILMPVALAILLSFVVAPAVTLLQRLKVPQTAAIIAVVTTSFAALTLLGFVVAGQLAGLVEDLPKYQTTISAKVTDINQQFGKEGPLSRLFELFHSVSRDVDNSTRSKAPATPQNADAPAPPPLPVTIQSGGSFYEIANNMILPVLAPIGSAALVVLFSIFVLSQREDLRNRFIRLAGTEDLQHTTDGLDDVARRLSSFFTTQVAINAGFGIVIAAGLWMIGVPRPVLWGIMGGVLRFIPYIGAASAAVLPLLLAFAVDPGWWMLIWTVALFVVAESMAGNVLEPLLYGHSTGLSPLAVILSATVWAFLWGPVGLVLATPMTLCFITLGRHVRELEFLDIMLGDRPALSPSQIFYQRMLAGDPAEAVRQAREFLRVRALATYYDEVALEGIRLAHHDIARGHISAARQTRLLASLGTLVEQLGKEANVDKPTGPLNIEATAAVSTAGPDRLSATLFVKPDQLPDTWREGASALCLAKAGTLDDIIARIVAQVLTLHGFPARTVDPGTVHSLAAAEAAGVRFVCLSYVEPLSVLHLRAAVRAVRRSLEKPYVALALWQDRSPDIGQHLRQAARADALVTTVDATLTSILLAAGFKPDALQSGTEK